MADLDVTGSLDPRFWRGRSVLVTGHTGFKGGWLALLLERLGAKTWRVSPAIRWKRILAPKPALECRSCRAPLDQLLVDLGMSPIANAFRPPDALSEQVFPLRAYVCTACWLVQLLDVAARDAHFHEGYAYFSSYAQSWVDHAGRYAEMAAARFGLGPDGLVVEVASNDGYLLQFFKAAGIPVLGVEPAANCAAVAQRERGSVCGLALVLPDLLMRGRPSVCRSSQHLGLSCKSDGAWRTGANAQLWLSMGMTLRTKTLGLQVLACSGDDLEA